MGEYFEIPVVFDFNYENVIGVAFIDDDGLELKIPKGILTEALKDITRLDGLMGLSIGIIYRKAEKG